MVEAAITLVSLGSYQVMAIHNEIMDINDKIMDTHNWIMDIHDHA